jgi:hypothetical protein
VTTESDAHWQKAFSDILLTNGGIQIDGNDEQPEKPPIQESCESGSNSTVQRDRASQKQHEAMIVTDDGMQIELRERQPEKAASDEMRQRPSKATIERPDPLKQSPHSICAEAGMQIDDSDEQRSKAAY